MFFLLPKYTKYNKPIINGLKYFSTQVLQSITVTIKVITDTPNDKPIDPQNLEALKCHLIKQTEGFISFVAPHIKAEISGETNTFNIPENDI